eukprot:scaffold31582_cov44-Prasinocladus_malaysianus.AAC.2
MLISIKQSHIRMRCGTPEGARRDLRKLAKKQQQGEDQDVAEPKLAQVKLPDAGSHRALLAVLGNGDPLVAHDRLCLLRSAWLACLCALWHAFQLRDAAHIALADLGHAGSGQDGPAGAGHAPGMARARDSLGHHPA